MFKEGSYTVRVWVENVRSRGYARERVPDIGNLREIVYGILDREA